MPNKTLYVLYTISIYANMLCSGIDFLTGKVDEGTVISVVMVFGLSYWRDKLC
ncbi:MAG: hypothetical protein LC723_12945 [Actinobacteria bacterium]|nr:hypothetical protein [Actinomycetota bacterium]